MAQQVESPQLDVGELQVSHDLQLVDAAQVLGAVPEVKQVRAVDGHLELVRLAQDQDLDQNKKIIHSLVWVEVSAAISTSVA